MSTRVTDRVDGWEQRSVSDGYRGLQGLADADFSGVVRAGGAELYMTKGTVVGVEGGSVEDFESADGTSYRAPSPALPLLAVMQGRSEEVRAKYYTEETPMSEVDRTLSEGGFTGYIELSENVLSGDYYLVYHQGRSMSVAFVGNSQQLVDGDEAFETADDEVGIYEVRPVAVGAIEIPEPEPTGGAAGSATDSRGEPDGQPEPAGSEPRVSDPTETETAVVDTPAEPAEAVADPERTGQVDQPGAADPPDETAAGSSTEPAAASRPEAEPPGSERDDTDAPGEATDPEPEPEPTEDRSGRASGQGSEPGRETRGDAAEQGATGQRQGGAGADESTPGRDPAPLSDPGVQPNERPASEPAPQSGAGPTEAEDGEGAMDTAGVAGEGTGAGGDEGTGVALETQSVPSLSPARTSPRANDREETAAETPSESTRQTATEVGTPSVAADTGQEGDEQAAPDGDTGSSGSGQSVVTGTVDSGTTQAAEPEEVERLREQLEDRAAELDRLETELAEERDRREELQAEVTSLQEERDGLAAEVERLETELERVKEEFGVVTGAQQRLSPAEALDGTDLFVRYRSKNGMTLTDAHDGEGGREGVTENLRLEQHTQFDAGEVAVDGQDYDTFIRGRVEYQFVTWLVEELLFEVRDAGGVDGLGGLYDALPEVDRAELSGTIAVRYTEDGAEQRGQETFDVVLRDRMGDPLFVANLNDSRQGATEEMMGGLITAAERVGGTKDSLAGALLVTESFFEPEALETAAEATKDGLLSRDKRRSFVNLSRKRGYHLCLVEARNQNFHLAVPEL